MNSNFEECIRKAEALFEQHMSQKPAPLKHWLRSDWKDVCFGLPLWTPEAPCYDTQAVWASKKGSVSIHWAVKTGNWANVDPLGIKLAMADNVMFK